MPGAIADWLNKGHTQMCVLKSLEGTSSYAKTQEAYILEAQRRNIQIPTNIVSIRKNITDYEKIGFIEKKPALKITPFGNDFVNAKTLSDRRMALRRSLLDIHFWNPSETKMRKDFNIYPYKAVLYLLLKLDYLTKLEIGNKVVLLKKETELDDVVEDIKKSREEKKTYPSWTKLDGKKNMDIENPVVHMMSLYSATDYILKGTRNSLILNPNKASECKNLFLTDAYMEEDMIAPPSQRTIYEAKPATLAATKIIAERKEGKTFTYVKDPAKLERASTVHQEMINKMIKKMQAGGVEENALKQSNRIDLFAIKNGELLLMEMKSMNPTNNVAQIRRGISQLMEYEFFDLPEERKRYHIKKMLVLESKPINKEYIDFIKHCGIDVLWMEEGCFRGPEDAINLLNYFCGG